jgi:hypothetical protein
MIDTAADPLVSVVIPLYNAGRSIAETLDSALGQDYPRIEVIVVDNGSTDDGVRICRRYRDPRLRLVSAQGRGLAVARNFGIACARGEIVAFLDADDRWRPTKISAHVAHFRSSESVGVSFCCSEFMDPAGHPLGLYQYPRLTRITPRDLFESNPVGNGSAFAIRRDVLDEVGDRGRDGSNGGPVYFNQAFQGVEDHDLWLRIALRTRWEIEGIAEPLALYRVGGDSMTADLAAQSGVSLALLEHLACVYPDLHRACAAGYRARAHLHLARVAFFRGESRRALAYCLRALRSKPAVFGPVQYLVLGASVTMIILPRSWATRLRLGACRVVGCLQAWRMRRESSRGRRR